MERIVYTVELTQEEMELITSATQIASIKYKFDPESTTKAKESAQRYSDLGIKIHREMIKQLDEYLSK